MAHPWKKGNRYAINGVVLEAKDDAQITQPRKRKRKPRREKG